MAARKSISWILDFTNKLPNDKERIKCLQANGGPAMRAVLEYGLNPAIKWALPPGVPDFEENGQDANDGNLYAEARKLYLFIEGGNDRVHQIKRENIFLSFLSSISKEDADMIVAYKDGENPFPNITWKLVKKAFPDMGQDNGQK